MPVDYLKGLAAYWADGYDWRRQEARLNELPQFTTEIDGQTVHFANIRSENPDALPLLLAHDWPASFVAFLDVVEPLSRDFHLVLTNTPGVAFSGTAGSSANWYYESAHDPAAWAPKPPSTVPMGVALARSADITVRRYAERDAPVTHWTELDRGGNFLSLEQPAAYAADVRAFFASLGD